MADVFMWRETQKKYYQDGIRTRIALTEDNIAYHWATESYCLYIGSVLIKANILF